MNRKALPLFLLLILSAAAVFVYYYITRSRIPEMQSDLVTISDDMILGVVIGDDPRLISEDAFLAMDTESYKKEIELASEMGARLVRIDINGSVLDSEEKLKNLDEIVKYARRSDLNVCLGVFGRKDWANSSVFYENGQTGSGAVEWNEFSEEYKKEAYTLVGRYEPEYLLIFPECSNFLSNQINSEQDTDEWLSLAKTIALNMKAEGSESKVIVGGALGYGGSYSDDERELLRVIMEDNDPIIRAVSINAYDIDDLDGQIGDFMELKEKYHWHGEVWMGEIALLPGVADSYFNNDFDSGQENFFLYALHTASKNNFNGFMAYNFRKSDESLSEGIISRDYSERPVYNALKEVIED